ncbi:DCDC2 protein, partial [Polypterus senegalus]
MSVSSKLYTPQASPAKTILMYRNGDPFFPGRKFIINPRQTPSFENFLSSVTQGIEAQFGAVRNVYTPLNGHRVLAMEHLQHGQRYVAAGAERFKKLDVFKNGDVLVPPIRILIPKYTLRSWDRVLALITEKIRLRTGAVHSTQMWNLVPRPNCQVVVPAYGEVIPDGGSLGSWEREVLSLDWLAQHCFSCGMAKWGRQLDG